MTEATDKFCFLSVFIEAFSLQFLPLGFVSLFCIFRSAWSSDSFHARKITPLGHLPQLAGLLHSELPGSRFEGGGLVGAGGAGGTRPSLARTCRHDPARVTAREAAVTGACAARPAPSAMPPSSYPSSDAETPGTVGRKSPQVSQIFKNFPFISFPVMA